VRLTVVTTFGLIGMATSSFLGMNLIAEAESPMLTKWLYFLLFLIPTGALTLYTIVKSRRLSEFLERLADERASSGAKLAAFISVWKTKHGGHL
jgi:hypothetical protein